MKHDVLLVAGAGHEPCPEGVDAASSAKVWLIIVPVCTADPPTPSAAH